MLDLGRRWAEGRIDRGDLSGMNRELSGEALAGRGLRFLAQSFLVTEVGEDAVYGLHAGRRRSGEAKRTRQLVGVAESAVRITFRRSPESRGQIFRAPAHRDEGRLRIAIAEQPEQACRRLGHDCVDGDVAGAVRELGDVAAAL